MTIGTPAATAARNGSMSWASSWSGRGSTAMSWWLSVSVPPCPGKCLAQEATPRASGAGIQARSWRETSAGSAPKERVRTIGLRDWCWRAATGAYEAVMPRGTRCPASAGGAGAGRGELVVVDPAERVVAGDLGCARADQVPDTAALVVDGHEQVGAQCPQPLGEGAELIRVAHAAGEEEDTSGARAAG